MSLPSEPAAEYEAVAGRFSEVVDGVRASEWDAPTPVEGWRARDVVGHLTTWFPAFLTAGAGIALTTGPDIEQDPAGAWHHLDSQVRALFGTHPDDVLRDPRLGEVPLATAVSRFYTGDVFLHTWDLARATEQDDTLDPQRCLEMYDGMLPMEAILRSSGHYGPAFPLAVGSGVQERLLAFIGRNPWWPDQPEARG